METRVVPDLSINNVWDASMNGWTDTQTCMKLNVSSHTMWSKGKNNQLIKIQVQRIISCRDGGMKSLTPRKRIGMMRDADATSNTNLPTTTANINIKTLKHSNIQCTQ